MNHIVINRDKIDASARLPEFDVGFLPVGATFRQSLGHYEAPCEVRSANDLPSRLYLGTLLPESFRVTTSGWSARYGDAAPDTYVDLDYKAPRGPLFARFVWAGINGVLTATSGLDWIHLARQVSLGFPGNWEAAAKGRIETAFNARCIAPPVNASVMTGFPDGAFETLVFPVPSYRLHELPGCLAAIDRDPDIAAVVVAFVVKTLARIDYAQGRCPDVPDRPEALASHSRHAVGLACHGLPQFQSAADNLRILSLNRHVFLVHVSCVFRDLTRVVSHWHRHGFIGTSGKSSSPSDYPDGAEWSAMVLPSGMVAQGASFQYFDEGRTRRLAYGRLLPPERLSLIPRIRDVSRTEVSRRLLAAEAWAFLEPDVVWPNPVSRVH